MTILGLVLVFPLIFLGFYLIFYKRKLPAGVSHTAWIEKLDIPEFAKEVRRKEANKQTAKRFTCAWLKEYCRGQRTAFSAWYCWFLGLPLITVFCIAVPILLIINLNTLSLGNYFECITILVCCYYIFASYIWWKCAINSKRHWKYFTRISCGVIAIDRFAMIIFLLTSLFFPKIILDNPELTKQKYLTYFNHGQELINSGKAKEGISELTTAIQLNPTFDPAYFLRGMAYIDLKPAKYEQAIQDFTKVISLNPKISIAYAYRGFAYDMTDKYDAAFADCNKAIELDPKNEDALFGRATLYLKKGNTSKAMEDINNVIQLSPKTSKAYEFRAAVYKQMGKNKEALADSKKAKLLE